MKLIKNIKAVSRMASTRRERGTILILAIAVLAVLSLLAVSYVTVVRIDRDSSDAVAVSRDFDQQVNTVIRHMQSLLAADMFGNKVVTNSVPRVTTEGLSIWPSMFEDGEFWDIDSTDVEYWRNWQPSPTLQNGRILRVQQAASRRVARPDDSWLASTEPRWQNSGFQGQPYFEQFTNLRSAFTWDSQDQQWVRGDGLYVDLAQWFLNPIDGRANAGVDLLDPTGTEVTAVRTPRYSLGREVQQLDGVDYTRQMSQLTPGGNPSILQPSDERFFADTTGDLRPDAQWTQLEELGNLFGLNWVVAARITDASALVNLNTAIESPAYNLTPGTIGTRDYHEVVGTGETPADVDLVRLLTYNYGLNLPSGVYPNGVPNVSRILNDGLAFRNHLYDGLGYRNVLSTLQDNATPGYIPGLDPNIAGPGQGIGSWDWSGPAGSRLSLTRSQRRFLYEQAYSRTAGDFPRAQRYPERGLLDLHAFWGTNNVNLISKSEQYLDGPEAGGFLPSLTNLPGNGPLRAAEINAGAIRAFGAAGAGRPTLQQIEFDNRRLLTTVSGAGRFSPVPVLNKDNNVFEFDGVFFREKHSLFNIVRGNEFTPKESVREVFADMIWALAPFATNKELLPPAQSGGNPVPFDRSADADRDFHYGGGANGPAQAFGQLYGTPNLGPAYAIHRAGAFAVNLADALDINLAAPPVDALLIQQRSERPTVLRFYPTTEFPNQLPTFQGYEQVFANARFAHGDLEIQPSSGASRFLGEGFGGISFIGVDRQPFLVEAHTLAAYQSPQLVQRPTISPDNPNHFLGSVIAFEIANPWPAEIRVGTPPAGGIGGTQPIGGHVVRIVRDQSWIEFRLPQVTIPAGGRAILYWRSDPDASAFEPDIMQQIFNGWLASVTDESAELTGVVFAEIGVGADAFRANIQASAGAEANQLIPFQTMATDLAGHTQVQLIRVADNPNFGAGNNNAAPPQPERKGDMLIDRMTTVTTSRVEGQGIVWDDFFGALRQQRTVVLQQIDGERPLGNQRLTVHGTMHRAPRKPANQEGFPGYVVEKPSLNTIAVAGHTDPGIGSGVSDFVQVWRIGANDGGGTDDGTGGNTGGNINDPLYGPDPDPRLWEPDNARRLARDSERPIFDNLPAYQLFNPGTYASSVSEVALVSAFSHMYLHEDELYPGGYSIIRVNPASTSYAGDIPGFGIGNPNGGRWLTFSEQLGFDFHLEGPQGSPAGTNPWFGKINPTRYRFNDNLANVPGLPDVLSVPLGSRMFDLFHAMSNQNFLTAGQINLNTAPRRVLSLLPLAEPLQQVQDGSGSVLAATPPAFGGGGGQSRAAFLFNYRERLGAIFSPANGIANWTGIPGLRSTRLLPEPITPRGFVSIGEIPLVGQRDQSTNLPIQNQIGTFLELASNNQNAKNPPFETWSDRGLPFSFGTSQQKAYAFDEFNPANDAEEQLALFRAIANIATTRSDVFMATFVLRGYDPDVIESIEIPGGTGAFGALQAMNDPLFRPAYESRWLVVFDRSNVRLPTDRPRVLLRVELPSAVP